MPCTNPKADDNLLLLSLILNAFLAIVATLACPASGSKFKSVLETRQAPSPELKTERIVF
jgi:hypothetical protein